MESLNTTSALLTLILILAAVLLGLSFVPMRKMYLQTRVYTGDWFALLVLIIMFISGYLAYAWLLWQYPPGFIDILAVSLFMGGACFVWVAGRLSRAALDDARRTAKLETHRAYHDELTHLPNRAYFTRQLDYEIRAKKENRDSTLAVIIMDLNRFQLINDTMGYYYGDLLLQEIARHLQGTLRKTDMLARLSGDEFGLIINPVKSTEALEKITAHIIAALEKPIRVEGHPADVGVSLGLARFPEDGAEASKLIKHAKLAVYEARRIGAQKIFYDSSLEDSHPNYLNLISELRQAVESNSLVVNFQPQVDVSKRQICGVEALVRWPHPRLGMLSPEKFVPLAEQSGLINLLSDWVLEIVFNQLADWKRAGIQLPIATNLSVTNLLDEGLFENIVQGIESRKLTASQLQIEITETSVMADPERALVMMRKLSRYGIQFSVDDFGTGYSSLEYLKRLPVNEVKIDKTFVQNVTKQGDDAAIIRSTIDLAHQLGLTVTAEGVETAEAMDLLVNWGCDKLQGYRIAPAMSIQEFNHKWRTQEINVPSLLQPG